MVHLQEISPPISATKSCIEDTVENVILFTQMTGIKTIPRHNAEVRLDKILNDWIKFLRKHKQKSDLEGKRVSFIEKLEKLSDIGANDFVYVVRNNRFLTNQKKDDSVFCRDQQNARLATMSGMDINSNEQLLHKQCRLQ